MTDVVSHYSTGGPYERVMAALDATAPDGAPLSLEQLGGSDEFHTGGNLATDQLATLVAPSSYDVVLDAGCGVGGP
ncbi:MAG: SAM-dependent methyltransferase, partial [Acidimicrobiia bacterium]